MYNSGVGYSALNTARSALSMFLPEINGKTVGESKIICLLMKGVFNIRPSLPRYTEVWDANVVLTFLKLKFPAKKLSLKDLTQKLVTLLALLSGQRVQTLFAIKLENIKFTNSGVTIVIDELLKQSRPSFHPEPLKFKEYAPDRRLCVVKYLNEYIDRTKVLRKTNRLLVSLQEPHHEVTKSTISRWVKNTLKEAGIDTKIFSAHSTRSAGTSKAVQTIPITELMKKVGWSSAGTFQKYYNKPVVTENCELNQAILQKNV